MNIWRKRVFGAALVALAIAIPIALLIASPWWLLLASIGLLAAWMASTRVGRQTWSVARFGMATLPQRLGSVSVVVISIAGVVGVLVALLAMAAGFESVFKQTGTDDTTLLLSGGREINSKIDHDTIEIVSQAPQVLKNAANQPIVSPELLVVTSLPKKSSRLDGNVGIRGVGEHVWELRPHVRITAGRKFKSGLQELIIGQGIHEQFAGTDVGATLQLNGQSWKIVGLFDSGDAHNSEIWSDTGVLGSAFRRGNGKTSLTVRLRNAGVFAAFKAQIARDPRLKVNVSTTREYYNRQSERITQATRILGMTVGALMAIGGILGALNAMDAAIATRVREIATLRAIGFRGMTVTVSVLLEAMLLAVLGGVVGAAIAWAIFDGYTASTWGGNFSQVIFAFNVSPALLWNGLKWALAIGLVGGLFPAIRAARMPITIGLREL